VAEMLRVSGIAVPVLVEGASETPMPIGETERAEDGSKIINRRTIKGAWKLKVAHRSPTDGVAWRKLLMGEGETFDFNSSLYGSKGSAPSAATNATQNATAKYGAGGCQLTASTGTISYAVLPINGTKWTVMVWRKVGAGAWVHYITTSTLKAAGDAYVDGVLNTSEATSWLTVTTATGTVKLDADGASTTNIDDLVILPFEIPSDWPASIVAYAAAFSRLARLDVDGDLIDANVGVKTVCANVTGVEMVPGTLAGVYAQSNRVLDVELEEV
jgi:hypothetical protein